MKCLDGPGTMRSVPFEGITIEYCTECFGVWLDDGEIAHIVEKHGHVFSPEARTHHLKRVGQDERVGSQPPNCPVCGAKMITSNYAYDSGVMIDRCPNNHGIWLNGGEFQKVQIVMEERLIQKGKALKSPQRKTEGKKERRCPRDGTPLVEVRYETEVLSGCPTCGGFWADEDELLAIIRSRDNVFHRRHFETAQSLNEKSLGNLKEQMVQVANCVDCGTPMQRVNYGYQSGIVLDRCASCKGVWLDHSELERVQIINEAWEASQADVTKEYSGLLQKTAQEAAERFDAAGREGVKAALGKTAAYRLYDFIERKEG